MNTPKFNRMSPKLQEIYKKIYSMDPHVTVSKEEYWLYIESLNDQINELIKCNAENEKRSLCRPIQDYINFKRIYIEFIYDLEQDWFFEGLLNHYKKNNTEDKFIEQNKDSIDRQIKEKCDVIIGSLSATFNDMLSELCEVIKTEHRNKYLIRYILAFPRPTSIKDIVSKIDLNWHYTEEVEAAWSQLENKDQMYKEKEIIWIHVFYENYHGWLM